MAVLESCCGCSLVFSSAVLGVYLLVAYVIAFTIELWWIIDSSVTSPVAAYLLCSGYLILFAFSAVLLRGLSVKRTTFLLVWLFMMGILLGPEAGLVLYLSIHYWNLEWHDASSVANTLLSGPFESLFAVRGIPREAVYISVTIFLSNLYTFQRVTSIYGLIEITCWACRLLVNSIGFLCVQSLHSIWREERSVMLRLEALKGHNSKEKKEENGRGLVMHMASLMHGYNNRGYEDKDGPSKASDGNRKASPCNRRQFSQAGRNSQREDHNDASQIDYFSKEFSEFNASSFDTAIVDARLQNMPYLTIRKRPREWEKSLAEKEITPKAHSLIDLSPSNLRNVEVVQFPNNDAFHPLNTLNPSEDMSKTLGIQGDFNGSLEGKIIKNKNLKILKKLSPFCSKKKIEPINVYPINPPKDVKSGEMVKVSQIDRQLNTIYKTRGMYAFDEKTGKIMFYPPEFFRISLSTIGRSRINSHSSSLSRSSVDSEDIKHISDVAL